MTGVQKPGRFPSRCGRTSRFEIDIRSRESATTGGVSRPIREFRPSAPAEAVAAARDTAMNPAVLDAFALAISASAGPPAFPGMPGPEPDLVAARRQGQAVGRAMNELRRVAPEAGSYVAESDFFEAAWARSFWGSNYPRLAAVRRQYDPAGLFVVHHGVWGARRGAPMASRGGSGTRGGHVMSWWQTTRWSVSISSSRFLGPESVMRPGRESTRQRQPADERWRGLRVRVRSHSRRPCGGIVRHSPDERPARSSWEVGPPAFDSRRIPRDNELDEQQRSAESYRAGGPDGRHR
jgi:Berberine and berberine like